MERTTSLQKFNQQGFTLIELSIVLVIIGLIVGGVLVGQDLIKTAQVRSTITQINNYNAAVNSFHAKYNGYPGDLPSPANFFSTTGSGGTQGLADGNGLIESAAGAAAKEDGETVVAWYEMNQANEQGDVKGDPSFTDDAGTLPGTILPAAKTGIGSIGFRSGGGTNYFEIGIWGGTTGAATLGVGLTPIQAYGLDTKLDDGIPNTGTVIAINTGLSTPQTYTANGHATGNLAAGDCEDTTLNIYANATQVASNAAGCALSIRGSF